MPELKSLVDLWCQGQVADVPRELLGSVPCFPITVRLFPAFASSLILIVVVTLLELSSFYNAFARLNTRSIHATVKRLEVDLLCLFLVHCGKYSNGGGGGGGCTKEHVRVAAAGSQLPEAGKKHS